MDCLEYKGYKGTVEYSKADGCLVGRVLGMANDLILYEGGNITELEEDFRKGIDSYIEGCRLDGVKPRKPYGGTITIHISPDFHSRLAMKAKERGSSMSAMIRHTLEREYAY